MSKTIEESTVLQSMPVETRMKHYKGLLDGKSVPNQMGSMIELPGYDEQYIEQQSAVEGQRLLIDGLRAALKVEQDAMKESNSGDSRMAEDIGAQLRVAIVNLAMQENKLNTLGEQITSIRRRIKELQDAGTK